MKTLSRGLSLLALLAWGALMLYFYFSGRLADYLIPVYRPLVAVAGFVLLGLAAALAWGMRAGTGGVLLEDRADELASPGRVRATQMLAFALLVLPVWAAAGVSKDQFGVSAVLNRGIVSDSSQLPGRPTSLATPPPLANRAAASNNANPSAYEPPLPGTTPAGSTPPPAASDAAQYLQTTPDGHTILEVTDLLFAADDDSMRPTLEGRTAEVIGQFMPAKDDPSGNRFQLLRMFMVCCAADARPIAVMVEKPAGQTAARAATDKLPELGWTRVVGKIDFPLENGRRVAVLHAESATPTDPPREAMLY